jgi:hypothetical protein
MLLHPHLDGNGRKGVLTRAMGDQRWRSVVALSIEEGNNIEVEEVLPGLVPMMHKHSTSMRPTAKEYTGDRRQAKWLSMVVVVGGHKMRR